MGEYLTALEVDTTFLNINAVVEMRWINRTIDIIMKHVFKVYLKNFVSKIKTYKKMRKKYLIIKLTKDHYHYCIKMWL